MNKHEKKGLAIVLALAVIAGAGIVAHAMDRQPEDSRTIQKVSGSAGEYVLYTNKDKRGVQWTIPYKAEGQTLEAVKRAVLGHDVVISYHVDKDSDGDKVIDHVTIQD